MTKIIVLDTSDIRLLIAKEYGVNEESIEFDVVPPMGDGSRHSEAMVLARFEEVTK